MKKMFLFATAFVFSVAAMAQQKVDEVIKVNTETHSFGKIKQGIPVTYYFEITNVSNKPIVVENASASCGCTVPEKPAQPILPGKTDKIKVVFNAGAVGPINKDIYIKIADVPDQKIVHITGEVLTADAYDNLPKDQVKEVKETKDSKVNKTKKS
ncbi:MAG: DUF1573 domain-containing protein [Chitinophagaceae bacterium]